MEKGFSLVDAVVSAVILIVGVLAVVNLFPSSAVINARADRMRKATVSAEDKIEYFREIGYSTLLDTIAAGYSSGSDTCGNIIREWTLTQIGNVVEIRVDCSWVEPGSRSTRRVSYITYVSKHL